MSSLAGLVKYCKLHIGIIQIVYILYYLTVFF